MPEKTMRFPNAVGEEDLDRIENALRQLAGVSELTIARPVKAVTLRWDAPTSWDEVYHAVSDLGYVPDVEP
jgi:hypothetical protein